MLKKKIKKIIKYFVPWLSTNDKIYNLYKKSNYCFKKGYIKLANFYSYKIYKRYGCIISPKSEIGNNLNLPHPIGIVIGEGVKIGNNCIIYQNVTLGRKNRDISEYPIIKDNVIIYSNSTVAGKVVIGSGTIIGCNTVVLKSVDPNSRCVGVVK